jgi:hypothetical protein
MTPTQFFYYVSGWIDACRNNGDEANAEQLETLAENWERVIVPKDPPLPPFTFPAEINLILTVPEDPPDDADHERSGAVPG